ncbi:GGDEF domain-containing protein [Vibrio nitrifigilis]|uniref:diguanylate cyclase n=1 Tax=Vibrio nitrifigilis TaxID=2789781 RepID=A0ABS0GDG3_9VIBR|nr:diguanylate cyclase [Vibrio nitrifigilis]MBF9000410.1 diguanylate cyclase [Vibrio nitrifigilis]
MHTMSLVFNEQGRLISSTHSFDDLSLRNIDELVISYRNQQQIKFPSLKEILQKQFRIDVYIEFEEQVYSGNVTCVAKVDGQQEFIVSLKHATDNSSSPNDKMINILDSARIATWEWNITSDELHVNELWANILGYSLESIAPVTYKTWQDHLHPDYRHLLAQKLNAHYVGKEAYFKLESPVLNHEGEWIWVKDIGRVVSRLSNGEPEWVFGARIDINRSKMAQLELEKLQEQLDELMALSPSVIYKMASDRDAKVLFVSSGVERLLGYSAEELVGKPHWWCSHIAEEDLAEYQRCTELTKERSYHPIMDCEYRFTKANGESVWLVDRIRYVDSGDEPAYFVGSVIDLSEFITLNQHLKSLSLLPPGVIYQFEKKADGHMSFPYVSQEFEHVFGVSPKVAAEDALRVFEVIHPDDVKNILNVVDQSFLDMSDAECEFRITRDDKTQWYYFQSSPIQQGEGSVLWSGQVINITDRKNMELQLEKESTTDPLTGTYNRRFLLNRVKELKQQHSEHDWVFSLISIDFDHFKAVNDDYGHDGGDAVLKQTVKCINKNLRDKDVFARMGGEEFVIFLPDTSHQAALIIAERIRQKVEHNVIQHRKKKISITITQGVASSTQSDSIQELLKISDRALYLGKKRGRNCVV